jgi:hypothetical protein
MVRTAHPTFAYNAASVGKIKQNPAAPVAQYIIKEALIKWVPLMVRQAHTQRVREPLRGHERVQKVTARPELVEGLVQCFIQF